MVGRFPDYTRPCCTILEHQNFLSVIHYPLTNFLYPHFSKRELLSFSKRVLDCASPFLEFTLETTLSALFPPVSLSLHPAPHSSSALWALPSKGTQNLTVSQKSSGPRLSCLHYPNPPTCVHSFSTRSSSNHSQDQITLGPPIGQFER